MGASEGEECTRADSGAALAQLNPCQAATLRWLSVGGFANANIWSLINTAQTGIGLQLAPSRGHLLAMMSTIITISAAGQFLLLPLCGKLCDTVGRRPVLMARGVCTTIFPLALALRPSYPIFCIARLLQNMTSPFYRTAVDAALADVFEGQALAVASAKVESAQGLAMLIGPLVGGALAERSFRLCYALSGCAGLVLAVVREQQPVGPARTVGCAADLPPCWAQTF